MKGKRYTEEQIVTILNTIERSEKSAGEACRQAGVSENTYYRWKKKYHGLETQDVRKMRELERENAKLKKLLADCCLEDRGPLHYFPARTWRIRGCQRGSDYGSSDR